MQYEEALKRWGASKLKVVQAPGCYWSIGADEFDFVKVLGEIVAEAGTITA